MLKLFKHLSVGLLLVCSIFFFVGGPSEMSARSAQRAWDLGHTVFFFAASFVWLRWDARAHIGSRLRSWIIVLVTVNVLGFVIEGAQSVIGRDASLADIFLDNVGAILALAFGGTDSQYARRWAVLVVKGGALALLMWAVAPLFAALADEVSAAGAFPVLADFETPFQLSRWESDVELSMEHSTVRKGRGSMMVPFSRAPYSTASLAYFPGDWSGATTFAASIFNPELEPLEIVLRVHDEWHETHGRRYDDRFNKVFEITPGWNDLTVPLAEIAAAPRNRELDLSRIDGLSFFTVELPEPRTIFIDQVELR